MYKKEFQNSSTQLHFRLNHCNDPFALIHSCVHCYRVHYFNNNEKYVRHVFWILFRIFWLQRPMKLSLTATIPLNACLDTVEHSFTAYTNHFIAHVYDPDWINRISLSTHLSTCAMMSNRNMAVCTFQMSIPKPYFNLVCWRINSVVIAVKLSS